MGLRSWLIKQSLSDRRSGSLASRLRATRWKLVQDVLHLTGVESVVDVGGTDKSWWFVDWKGKIVRCNIDRGATESGLRILADGRLLPFPERSFDIAFSNSVIEHVGNLACQTEFANEMRRTGRSYFLQTPNRWFPIEPHYLFPCFQFLPVWLQRWLHMHFGIGTFHKTDPFGQIRLLTKRELRIMFPEARIIPEQVGPFVKSWYVVHYRSG